MIEKNVALVGWYHSHPKFPAHPTLRDCDAQLDYQIKMRGPSDATYSPCVGVICCKFLFLFIFCTMRVLCDFCVNLCRTRGVIYV